MAQILFDQLRDFTGGVNFRADQFQLAANESPFILNLDVDPRGGIFSRAGYKKKNTTAVVGSWNPKGLFNYKHTTIPSIMLTTGFTDGATPSNGKVYYSTGDNFTTLNTSSIASMNVLSTNGASMTQWQDTLYMAVGKDSSNMYKWTQGDTYVTSLIASSPTWQPYQIPVGGYMPRAELVVAHANKMFVANTYEYNNDATPTLVDCPNRLRWSHENSPENWYQQDYIDIIAGGDGIRGLAIVDGQLLIFKPKAIYLLMGYDADSFQLVELTTVLGIDYPQQVVAGNGGAYFFDYPGGLFFYDRNGIQSLFDRLKPIIDTNRINANRLYDITLSYVNDRVWMSAPFDLYDSGTNPDYSNMNFIFDPSIGRQGAFTLYQSATYANAATPSAIMGYGLVSGCDWQDSNDDVWHLMINPNDAYAHVMYVDEFDYTANIPTNVTDDILEGNDLGDFETFYKTAWFYDDRYVQDKTFVNSLYVVKAVTDQTQIKVNVYHNFNTKNLITNHTIFLDPIISGGTYSEDSSGGVYGTAVYGESVLKQGIQVGGRLKRAKAVQLEFVGPTGEISSTTGREWGLNSIAFKYKRRQIRSNS